jgi:hypothetical protein
MDVSDNNGIKEKNIMQPVRIESSHITLPAEVLRKLKGKEVRFLESEDGFFIKPVSDPIREARGFLKKSRVSTEQYFQMKQEEKRLEK